MGTHITNDIYKDLKLLINSLTGFEEKGQTSRHFRLCEKFVLSNIKNHNYLPINSHIVRRSVNDLKEKFIVHGNYKVAERFTSLVDSLLTSSAFNFDQHPQHDLQWTLLSLLIELSNETSKSVISTGDDSIDALGLGSDDESDDNFDSRTVDLNDSRTDINWEEYLKEGQQEFFTDFKASQDSDELSVWSEEEDAESNIKSTSKQTVTASFSQSTLKKNSDINCPAQLSLRSQAKSKSLEKFTRIVESQKWLEFNVENTWWSEKNSDNVQVPSVFPHAHFCEIYESHREPNEAGKSETSLITEYQACREVLWMLTHQAVTSSGEFDDIGVVYEKISDDFSVNKSVSISSLSPKAFQSAFSNFIKYFSTVKKLNCLLKNADVNINSIKASSLPFTCETYSTSLMQYFNRVKEDIIDVEKKSMQRNSKVTTFLTLSKDLEPIIGQLNMLRDIHQSVLTDELLKSQTNWEKSHGLLLNLYHEIENSSSRSRTNLCASLYLSSLRVYLNIIDTWLTEGRLEDFRDEFLVFKKNFRSNFESTCSEDGDRIKMASFAIRPVQKEGLGIDPIVKKLLRKIEEMGRNIDLLVTLNRISDMWKMNAEIYESLRIPLSEEFISYVIEELSKYGNNWSDAERSDQLDAATAEFEIDKSTNACDLSKVLAQDKDTDGLENGLDAACLIDLEENIRQQIRQINNPFLMKVFQNYLPPLASPAPSFVNFPAVTASVDTVDLREKNLNKGVEKQWGVINIFEKLEETSKYILPFRKALEKTLDTILDRRYSCASKLVKNILIDEYKLERHLKLMRSIYMMERGHIMRKFYQHMFNEIENRNLATYRLNPYGDLSNVLEQVLSDEWRDSSSQNRWSITILPTDSSNTARQVIQAIENTTLDYSIDWPINMVLAEPVLAKYNEIFRFQLKLKWALWTLNNLLFKDLEGSSEDMKDFFFHFNARRLECLRFWLLHAIGSIHTYLSGQVLQSLGLILENSLAQAKDLDTIIQIHNDYLDKAHEHCLQTPQFADIMTTINNLLEMCAHIRDRWKRGVKHLMPQELDVMEKKYIKFHTYLALALHNAVQHKEADYLASLTAAFNCSMPQYSN